MSQLLFQDMGDDLCSLLYQQIGDRSGVRLTILKILEACELQLPRRLPPGDSILEKVRETYCIKLLCKIKDLQTNVNLLMYPMIYPVDVGIVQVYINKSTA